MSREREEHFGTADLLDRGQAMPGGMRDDRVDAPDRADAMSSATDHHAEMEHRDAVESSRMDGSASSGMASEQLTPLFDGDAAQHFRGRWTQVQGSFVDDPRRAVQQADELVAQVMTTLAQSFARQRSQIESDMGGAAQADTEHMRIALRRYRSFFERLLSL